MNNLSFEHFIKLKEMAIAQFGKHAGKHINDINSGYATWLLNAIQDSGKLMGSFSADDKSGNLSKDQVIQALKIRARNGKVAPTSVHKPIESMDSQPKKTDRTPAYTSFVQQKPEKKDAEKKPEKEIEDVESKPPLKQEKPKETPTGENPHVLNKEKLSEEQKDIDEDFEKMMSGSGNHMMINALAGTGKTTILKHLAWKYGKPGQKWLYLVFNAKNRSEAKETTNGWGKFPQWVEIHTTNSFLGQVLKEKGNHGIIPSTERMSSLERGGDQKRKLEKARAMVDGTTFAKIMTDVYKLPDWDAVKNDIPYILGDLGVPERRSRRGEKTTFYEICEKTLKSITDSILYNFKDRVVTLLGILKSFAVDPRDENNLRENVLKIFKKYDSHTTPEGEESSGYFDTDLEDVKERISKYKPDMQRIIISALKEILGYDFMPKNYKEEVIAGAEWLLIKSLPHNTEEKWDHRGGSVNLGEYRDFNDDIWFPTIYAEKLVWPKYDVILADEVQDFNEGQKVMLKKLIDAGAKVVAVGDPNQAIYRFRGADNDAFDNLAKMLKSSSKTAESWKPKTLSKNFRSRPEVLDHVNQVTHVKDLKAGKTFKDSDPPAEVTNQKIKYNDSFDMIAKERGAGSFIETAYISRTNQPLVEASLKLLANGIPFAIIGKDVTADLIKHIEKIMRDTRLTDGTDIGIFRRSLESHFEKEVEKNKKYSTKKEHLSNLKDTTSALLNCIDMFLGSGGSGSYGPSQKVGEFKRWLEAKLGNNTFDWNQSDENKSEADLAAYKEKLEKEKPIILTTAHKSKGLEFARVFILRNDQFPHPKAKHPEELGQESNTKYVAYTRAMHQLHILDEKDQPGVPKGSSPQY